MRSLRDLCEVESVGDRFESRLSGVVKFEVLAGGEFVRRCDAYVIFGLVLRGGVCFVTTSSWGGSSVVGSCCFWWLMPFSCLSRPTFTLWSFVGDGGSVWEVAVGLGILVVFGGGVLGSGWCGGGVSAVVGQYKGWSWFERVALKGLLFEMSSMS